MTKYRFSFAVEAENEEQAVQKYQNKEYDRMTLIEIRKKR